MANALTPAHCFRLVVAKSEHQAMRRQMAAADWKDEAWIGQKVAMQVALGRRESEMHAALAAFYRAIGEPHWPVTVLYIDQLGNAWSILIATDDRSGVYAYIDMATTEAGYDIAVRHTEMEVAA
jgi:hypothetical protein